jgi:hypothetical protein
MALVPRLARDDCQDGWSSDAKASPQFSAAHGIGQGADGSHIFMSQLGTLTSPDVLGMSEWFNVVRVHAQLDITQVVRFKSFRNWPPCLFVIPPMRLDPLPVSFEIAIAIVGRAGYRSLPNVTRRLVPTVLNSVRHRLRVLMPVGEPVRLPLDVARVAPVARPNAGALAASALTEPFGDGIVGMHRNCLPSRDEEGAVPEVMTVTVRRFAA